MAICCPASIILAGWRQSVLPVHLLGRAGLAPLLGGVGAVAGDVKLQDNGVVHDLVNCRGGQRFANRLTLTPLPGTLLQRGAAVRAGMVENRSFEMSVGMLSPSSATEVCGADAEGYNARTVLPQGASDVQSIRASQTADPRVKQTRPSGPARRSVRVNTRPSDGDSPGSMPAGRFYLGEVVESFLGQPLLAGLPALAATLPRASPLGTWAGGRSASTSRPRPLIWSTSACSSPWATCSTTGS